MYLYIHIYIIYVYIYIIYVYIIYIIIVKCGKGDLHKFTSSVGCLILGHF